MSIKLIFNTPIYENTLIFNNIYSFKKVLNSDNEFELSNPIDPSFINDHTFRDNTMLKNVIFSGTNLSVIGQTCFSGCSNLETVTILSPLKEIKRYAFYNCTSLQSIIFPSTITTLGVGLCENCFSLSSAVFQEPANITILPENIFKNCRQLQDIVIPEGVTVISSNSFFGCSNLEQIKMANSVSQIGSYAFKNCTNLTTIVYSTENNNKYIQGLFDSAANEYTLNIDSNQTISAKKNFAGELEINGVHISLFIEDIYNNHFLKKNTNAYINGEKIFVTNFIIQEDINNVNAILQDAAQNKHMIDLTCSNFEELYSSFDRLNKSAGILTGSSINDLFFLNNANFNDISTVQGLNKSMIDNLSELNGLTGYAGIIGQNGPVGQKGTTGSSGFMGDAGHIGHTGRIGDTGPTGIIGFLGTKGTSGEISAIGTKGPTGIVGRIGENGNAGEVGYTGESGSVGHTGQHGENGVSGYIGHTGHIGDRGYIGEVGPTGIIGFLGIKGYSGEISVIGSKGPTGNAGQIGENGTAGEIGYVGGVGLIGHTGQVGARGDAGFIADAGFVGNTGFVGIIGPTGTIGLAGNNGVLGERGKIGTNGPTGNVGQIGENGTEGKIGENGTTGEIGYIGHTGEIGNIGEKGSLGYAGSISEVLGEIGEAGIYGENGKKGDAGDIGLIGKIGDVGIQSVSGEIGMSGSVGVYGKKGEVGSIGPQGEQGYAGEMGPTGIKGNTGDKGPHGEMGFTGVTGALGLVGPNAQGDKGPDGDIGPTGIIGLFGAPGPRGVIGDRGSDIHFGATGPMGPYITPGTVVSVSHLTSETSIYLQFEANDFSNINILNYATSAYDVSCLVVDDTLFDVPSLNTTDTKFGSGSIGFNLTSTGPDAGYIQMKPVLFDKDISWSVWIKPIGQQGCYIWACSQSFGTLGTQDLAVSINTSNKIHLYWNGFANQLTPSQIVDSINVFDGNWHHIVFTFNSDTKNVTLYYDSNKVLEYTLTNFDVENRLIHVLGRGTWRPLENTVDNAYRGRMDEFMFFENKLLTQSEVTNLYNQTPPVNIPNLGPNGMSNIRGMTGFVGAIGNTGTNGPQGPKGVVGDIGPKGEIGAVGPTGIIGMNGFQGENGLNGGMGDVGPTGKQGETGVKGSIGDTGLGGINNIIIGCTGFKNEFREAGDIGCIGEIGIIGDTGPNGPIGILGDVGITGPNGFIGSTGETGPHGIQGNVYNTSQINTTELIGPTGINYLFGELGNTGCFGPTGTKGDNGVTGMIGLTGPQGSIGSTGTNIALEQIIIDNSTVDSSGNVYLNLTSIEENKVFYIKNQKTNGTLKTFNSMYLQSSENYINNGFNNELELDPLLSSTNSNFDSYKISPILDMIYDPSNDRIVICGSFIYLNDVLVNYVCYIQNNKVYPMGNGFNSTCRTLSLDGSYNLYAGGDFTTDRNKLDPTTVPIEKRFYRFAMWDNLNQDWTNVLPSGTQIPATVRVIKYDPYLDYLYVGGSFSATGLPNARYARAFRLKPGRKTNLTGIEPIAGGLFNGHVYTYAFDNSNNYVYIGGSFANARDANGSTTLSSTTKTLITLAQWNSLTQSYSLNQLAGGIIQGSFPENPIFTRWVNALEYDNVNKNLYIGGAFSDVSNSQTIALTSYCAMGWNGTQFFALGPNENPGFSPKQSDSNVSPALFTGGRLGVSDIFIDQQDNKIYFAGSLGSTYSNSNVELETENIGIWDLTTNQWTTNGYKSLILTGLGTLYQPGAQVSFVNKILRIYNKIMAVGYIRTFNGKQIPNGIVVENTDVISVYINGKYICDMNVNDAIYGRLINNNFIFEDYAVRI
jgi:hypothetical protein